MLMLIIYWKVYAQFHSSSFSSVLVEVMVVCDLGVHELVEVEGQGGMRSARDDGAGRARRRPWTK